MYPRGVWVISADGVGMYICETAAATATASLRVKDLGPRAVNLTTAAVVSPFLYLKLGGVCALTRGYTLTTTY